jgi:hypothetical protein
MLLERRLSPLTKHGKCRDKPRIASDDDEKSKTLLRSFNIRQTFEARKYGKLWKTCNRYIREKKTQRTEVPFHWRLCIGGSPLEPFLCKRMGQGGREMERGKMHWLLLCTHLGEGCNISLLSHAIHIPPCKASRTLWRAFRLNRVKLPLFCKQKMLKKQGLRPYGSVLSPVPL